MAFTINFSAPIIAEYIDFLIRIVDEKVNSGEQDLDLIISTSTDGDMNQARLAFNYLRGTTLKVTTYNYGSLFTPAIILFSAGTRRICSPSAKFVLHEAHADIAAGNITSQQLSQWATSLALENRATARLLADGLGLNEDNIAHDMAQPLRLLGEDAVKYGLAHEVRSEVPPLRSNVMAIPPTPSFAEALASVGRSQLIQFLIPISPWQKPYPDFPLDQMTQTKVITTITMMELIGRGPGDFPINQAINYRKLQHDAIESLKRAGVPADRDFAPLAVDYVALFEGGNRLPDPQKASLFYSRLIHFLVIETQLLITIQYYHGMELHQLSIPYSVWSDILSPEEQQGIAVANIAGVDLRELRGRIFFEYMVIMIRAQWDKLVRLTCGLLGLKDNWNSVSDGLAEIRKYDTSHLHPWCRSHLEIFAEIAVERLKDQNQGGWLKPQRDSLVHFFGIHSAGVIPQRKSQETTSQLWEHVRDEHHWLREGFMSLLIVLLTIKRPY